MPEAGLDIRAKPAVLSSRRVHAAVVATTVVLLSVPYAIGGPNLLADDWVYVRNGQFNGAVHAAGSRQVQRPGATVLYDATFGLIGPHPLALYAVQVGLWVAAAVALLMVASRFTSPGRALAIALLWVVLPTHGSLEHWASTGQALLALALLCVGVGALDAARSVREELVAVGLLAASMLTYELVVPAAIAAMIAVPLLRRRTLSPPALLSAGVLVTAAFAWLLVHRTVYTDNRGRLDLAVALRTLFSLGLNPTTAAASITIALIIVVVGVAATRLAVRRDRFGDDEAIVITGLAIVLLGLAPLFEFSTNLRGVYDRLTLVSGVGVVLICVGGIGMIRRAVRSERAPIIAAAFAIALIATAPRIAQHRDYLEAGRAALTEARRLAADTAPHETRDITGPVAEVHGISGLSDGWNTTAAVQLLKDDPTIRIYVELNGERTGA